MIVLRQNNYSKKEKSDLKETRIGIGWLQDKMGKNEAEETFRDINDQINEDYKLDKSDEEIIKNAKKAGKRSVVKRNILPQAKKALIKGVPAAAATYLLTKNSKLRNSLLEKAGVDLNSQKVNKVLKSLDKNKVGITAGVGSVAAGIELMKEKNVPRVRKQVKAAKNAGEITAKQRLKKKNSKEKEKQEEEK